MFETSDLFWKFIRPSLLPILHNAPGDSGGSGLTGFTFCQRLFYNPMRHVTNAIPPCLLPAIKKRKHENDGNLNFCLLRQVYCRRIFSEDFSPLLLRLGSVFHSFPFNISARSVTCEFKFVTSILIDSSRHIRCQFITCHRVCLRPLFDSLEETLCDEQLRVKLNGQQLINCAEMRTNYDVKLKRTFE